ncbi:hypothetical protein [Embleya sp. NPDC005971]|uniref:hypothetical protein n=1 Tax=Embleya sp. NPDC005971 TaxID=3156724 RepID=UPI0033DFE01A
MEGVIVSDCLPVRPPNSPYAARHDRGLRAASPLGASGYGVDAWCDPAHETRRYAGIVADGRAIVAGAARVDDPHVTHARWVERVIGRHALVLPRAILGCDLGIVASTLLCTGGNVVATVPMHQRGHGPGLLVDPRRAVVVVCLLAHDGSLPWARVAPYTPGCGYMGHDYAHDTGGLGIWPTLADDGQLWDRVNPQVRPGGVLYTDARTLTSYGTTAPWMALELVLVGRHGLVHGAADAPPVRTVSGSAVRWQARPRDVARLRGLGAA